MGLRTRSCDHASKKDARAGRSSAAITAPSNRHNKPGTHRTMATRRLCVSIPLARPLGRRPRFLEGLLFMSGLIPAGGITATEGGCPMIQAGIDPKEKCD